MLQALAIAGFMCFVPTALLKSQIPFGDFEEWEETDTLYRNPDQWSSLNEIHYLLGYKEFTISRTEGASSGNYALQAETRRFCDADSTVCFLVPGMAVLGDLYVNPADLSVITPGMEFNGRPEYVTGYYKYFPVLEDTFRVIAELSRSYASGVKEVVAYGEYRSEQLMTQFNTMNLRLEYFSDAMPDKIRLAIYSGVRNESYFEEYPVGSRLIIDNLQLGPEITTTGLGQNNNAPGELRLYPLPVQNELNLQLLGAPQGIYRISLFDATGRIILSEDREGFGHQMSLGSLSFRQLAAGTYLLRVTSADGSLLAARQIPVIH